VLLFFSNRLGCVGSLIVSAVATLLLLGCSRSCQVRQGSGRGSGDELHGRRVALTARSFHPMLTLSPGDGCRARWSGRTAS